MTGIRPNSDGSVDDSACAASLRGCGVFHSDEEKELMNIMAERSNFIKNIATVLLTLLLLGIAAAPASATTESVPISTGFGTIKSRQIDSHVEIKSAVYFRIL